jgi:hypothetical protein
LKKKKKKEEENYETAKREQAQKATPYRQLVNPVIQEQVTCTDCFSHWKIQCFLLYSQSCLTTSKFYCTTFSALQEKNPLNNHYTRLPFLATTDKLFFT